MTGIQFLLFGLVAAGVGVYLGQLRTRLTDRLIACGLAVAAAVGIAVPDQTTRVANLLGVGRGVDLVTYLMLFTLTYLWVLLFLRQRALQHRVTLLVRALAIADARPASAVEPVKKAA